MQIETGTTAIDSENPLLSHLDEVAHHIEFFVERNLSRLLPILSVTVDIKDSAVFDTGNTESDTIDASDASDTDNDDVSLSEEEMASFMNYSVQIFLSSINLFNHILTSNIEDIMKIIFPDKKAIALFITGHQTLDETMKTVELNDVKMQELRNLAISLYENNLLSMDYGDRLIHYVVRAARCGLSSDDPFVGKAVDEWVIANPSKITDIEMGAFEETIEHILTEQKADIEQFISNYVRNSLKSVFHLAMTSPDTSAFMMAC